ncbi:MAG: helix-turn-helix transcriptional regulator, partial [Acidiferrobacterales bacterium]
MDRTERFYKITQLLDARNVVPREELLEELGISLATLKRDLEYMRDRLHAPIIWDRQKRGYRFDSRVSRGPRFQLPGIWFNASEAHALLTMQHLLENIEPGVLTAYIRSLKASIEALLDSADHSAAEVRKRIRVLAQGSRRVVPKHFGVISRALLSRKRLRITHYSRERDDETTREVSPQRLVYYRDNWYLDAWCHWREALRSFAVESIHDAEFLDRTAPNMAENVLDAELGSGYGIFAGKKTETAMLRFTPKRARWVASEQWHPDQRNSFDAEGYYILHVPYTDERELVMDILKYG